MSMTPHDIGLIIKESYKKIYGREPSRGVNAFSGGNVGLIFLGIQIEKAANKLANAIESNNKSETDETRKQP